MILGFRDSMILGIETSCDDTSVGLVCLSECGCAGGRIISHHSLSQVSEHAEFGGVVPEIAARSHLTALDSLIRVVMEESGLDFSDLAGVAATAGPGLIGGISVGVMTAKTISYAAEVPFIAVNHLEGHALTVRLVQEASFPYILLLVSGGHCQLLRVRNVGDYEKLGDTLDDAIGESFDKCAKLLGLAYPGGPAVELAAQGGNSGAFIFPRPLLSGQHKVGGRLYDFSLSGLKSSVRRLVVDLHGRYGEVLPIEIVRDVCASFQLAVGDIICDRVGNIFSLLADTLKSERLFVVAGGVASNVYLRERLQALCRDFDWVYAFPPQALCTDNGAMIAWAGLERFRLGYIDGLDFAPRPRWGLEALALEALS